MKLSKLCRIIQLEPGDIVGVTDRGPLAVALRKRQAGLGEALRLRVASHIACVVGCRPGGGLDLVEATAPVVRPSRDDDIRGTVVFIWRPIGLDVEAYRAYLYDHEGVPYDYPALAALWGFGKQDPKRPYCSELGAGALRAGKYPKLPHSWNICCSPWDMQLHANAVCETIYNLHKAWW